MHLSVKSGAKGKGAAHAQYIEREGKYANRGDLVYSESGNMPTWAQDSSLKFWKAADQYERINGRSYRELEISLPRELSQSDQIKLVKEYVDNVLGDTQPYTFAIHNPKSADGLNNPHVHIMFSERNAHGFGYSSERFFKRNGAKKDRFYNSKYFVYAAREQWAITTNDKLAFHDYEERIDHRSYRDMGIDLESQNVKRIYANADNVEQSFTYNLSSDIRNKQFENGERIIENPQIALDFLTSKSSTFKKRDLEKFAFSHSDGLEQYLQVYNRILGSIQIQAIGDGDTFTTSDMLEIERNNIAYINKFNSPIKSETDFELRIARTHAYKLMEQRAINSGRTVQPEQKNAFDVLTNASQVATVNGAAGTGKSFVLRGVKEAYSSAGYKVIGTAIQGITAQSIEHDTGAKSYTVASLIKRYEYEKENPHEAEIFTKSKMVILVDEAGMIGSRDMNSLLRISDETGIKLRLVGDAYQMNSVAAGNAFTKVQDALHDESRAELTQIVRQNSIDDRAASIAMSRHHIADGLEVYLEKENITAFQTKDEARLHIVSQWANSDKSKVMLAYTNQDTNKMNEYARVIMRDRGVLRGEDVQIQTKKGNLSLAKGDEIVFNEPERKLGVLNGTRGKVEGIEKRDNGDYILKVSGNDGRKIEVNTAEYKSLSHGYATTIHKSQGLTVDDSFVLASKSMNANLTYVASTRHRDNLTIAYSLDEFKDFKDFTHNLSKPEEKTYSTDFNLANELDGVRAEIAKRETVSDRAQKAYTAEDTRIEALNKRIESIQANMDKPAREFTDDEVVKAVREVKGIYDSYYHNGLSFGAGDYLKLNNDYQHKEGWLITKETNLRKGTELLVKGVEYDKNNQPQLRAEVLQGNQRSGSDILISMDKANFKRSERYFKEFESNPSIRSKSLQSLNGSEIGYTKQQIKEVERLKAFNSLTEQAQKFAFNQRNRSLEKGKGLSR